MKIADTKIDCSCQNQTKLESDNNEEKELIPAYLREVILKDFLKTPKKFLLSQYNSHALHASHTHMYRFQ